MKDNKLLAEYLGIILYPDDLYIRYVPESILTFDIGDRWYPDSNWNHLMMVVEKICEDYFTMALTITGGEFPGAAFVSGMYCGKGHEGKTSIEAVYNACVEYIKSKA